MRIALVHQPWDDADPDRRDGSLAIWTWEVGRRLAQRHEVHVFGRRPDGAVAERVAGGIAFHGVRVEHDRPLLRLLRAVPASRDGRRPRFAHRLYHAAYAWKIARAAGRLGCDVIHVQNFSNFVPVLRRYNPRARIVLHMHCEWLSQLDRGMLAPRLAQTDALAGCSDYVVERIRRRFPEYADKCHTVPNGVDPARFASNGAGGKRRGCRRVLFVGRVSPEKGVHTLLGAFERVVAQRSGCSLEIVGPLVPAPREFIAGLCEPEVAAALEPCYDGDYIADLRRRAACCGAELAGPRPHETIPAAYRRADVLVNPSLSEAFGMSLVEAMAAGRAVIATRVGGMPEIVEDGVTGVLVPPGDEVALADAIGRLVEDSAGAAAMGARGREVVEQRYTWEHVTERVLEVYGGQ